MHISASERTIICFIAEIAAPAGGIRAAEGSKQKDDRTLGNVLFQLESYMNLTDAIKPKALRFPSEKKKKKKKPELCGPNRD